MKSQTYSYNLVYPREMPSRLSIAFRRIFCGGAMLVALAPLSVFAANSARPPEVDLSAPAIAPTEVITLYDGTTVNDLRCFYTWLGGMGYSDPNGVFRVVTDAAGASAIRVSGENWGGLVTRKSYRDYRLVLEYRWGEKAWNQRARNSGLLFHCQGEDGNYSPNFQHPWLSSVEYEIQEGRTGAVILVPGHKKDGSTSVPEITMRTRQGAIWDPEGEPRRFRGGFLFQSTYDVAWKNELGVRGRTDPDKPIGEWNRLELIAKGGDITYWLNGRKIMEATEGSYREGRILLQSEGAEIFFRRIELHPL